MIQPMIIRQRETNLLASLLFVVALVALAACSSSPTQRLDPPPNVIFLLADDQSAGTLSSAGHPVLQTPNLDQLASTGLVFNNAFTVQPICAPSRFAIFTSQYERTNGLGFSSPYEATEAQWDASYPQAFRKAGYYTGFVGKFGVEYYDFRGRTAQKFDYWKGHDGWLSFFVRDNPADTPIQAYAGSQADIATEIMGESIVGFLDAAPTDKPFQLSVSFSAPHGSMTSSMYLDADTTHCQTSQCRKMGVPANRNPRLRDHPVYDSLYRDKKIQANVDVQANAQAHLPDKLVGHQKRKQWYDYLYDPETNVEHMVRYYQQITGIDRVVGQLLEQLNSRDLLDNTIIIYTSDHGLLTGHYGVGGKGLLYDQSAKVPLIVVDPRMPGGKQTDALALTIDLAPTMLELAGIDPPRPMMGTSLVPLLNNPGAPWRDAVLLESLTTVEDRHMSEALRTQDWKYIRYFRTPQCPYGESDLEFEQRAVAFEQLFDLRVDPTERRNLAQEKAYFTNLQQLRSQLATQSRALSIHSQRTKAEANLPARAAGEGCW